MNRYECKKQPYYSKYLPHRSLCLPSCSKYRPQSSEPQTDGLSVSTTADGSQPNVRKLCDTPPPAPQAHTHNLAYYDNIICQVCPALLMFGPVPFPPIFLSFSFIFLYVFPPSLLIVFSPVLSPCQLHLMIQSTVCFCCTVLVIKLLSEVCRNTKTHHNVVLLHQDIDENVGYVCV